MTLATTKKKKERRGNKKKKEWIKGEEEPTKKLSEDDLPVMADINITENGNRKLL